MLRQYIQAGIWIHTLLYTVYVVYPYRCECVWSGTTHASDPSQLRLALPPSFWLAICAEDLCVSAKVAFQMDLYKNKDIITLAGAALLQKVQGECLVRESRSP